MLVWILMFIDAIIFPVVMIIIGLLLRNKAPKKINYFFGYRTNRAMKNQNTWEFANKYLGKLWFLLGLVLIIPSALPMFFLIDKSNGLICTVSLIICFIGFVFIIVSIVLTEKALNKTFDKDGNRINI